MTMNSLVKDALEDWSGQARVPVGLADRVLHRRARRRTVRLGLAAGSTALALGAAAVVMVTGSTELPSRTQIVPAPMSSDTSPGATGFPQRLVKAGNVAVGSYFTSWLTGSVEQGQEHLRTWYLYDPTSGRYRKTDWAYLDVAPGMRQAAVLEGPLPTSRVGLLDLKTRKVTHWIPVDQPVAGLDWSPDGRRLVLTSYSSNPDQTRPGGSKNDRTGYYVVDERQPGPFQARPGVAGNPNDRQDIEWSRRGDLLRSPTATGKMAFFTPAGKSQPAPDDEIDSYQPAGLSPNGSLRPESTGGTGTMAVTDLRTGAVVAGLPVLQAHAWVDDTKLIASSCAPKWCAGQADQERNRLVLVGLDGSVTALTDYQRSNSPGSWVPVFNRR